MTDVSLSTEGQPVYVPPAASPLEGDALVREIEAVAAAYYTQQASTARVAAQRVQSLWRTLMMGAAIDLTAWRGRVLPQALDTITMAQLTNATAAHDYIVEMAKVQRFEVPDLVEPRAFLTPQPQAAAKLDAAARRAEVLARVGMPSDVIARRTTAQIVRDTGDLVQDAGRSAMGAQVALTPEITRYVRKLQLPSCHRCASLAGQTYKWSKAFKRHPLCDCVHIPLAHSSLADEMTTDPLEALKSGQIKGLSEADKAAILEHGADFYQVSNAKRAGLRTEVAMGRKVQTTTSGTSRRGYYGQRTRVAPPKAARLTPAEIYKQAGSRDEARRLLTKYGYVIT